MYCTAVCQKAEIVAYAWIFKRQARVLSFPAIFGKGKDYSNFNEFRVRSYLPDVYVLCGRWISLERTILFYRRFIIAFACAPIRQKE
jgi:hypothetical protein